jgi:hypothetical protein
MKKEIKRILAVTAIEKKPLMKHLMIDAQVAEAKAKLAKIRDNKQGDE